MRAHRSLTATTAIVALAFLALLGTGTHTVVRGETLAAIAAAHGTSAGVLAQANGITDPNRILVGQRLTIPGAASTPASATYTVRRGDSLGSIAARTGTSIAALIGHNSLANPNLIRVGQVLSLPGAAASSESPSTTPTGGAQFHVVRVGDTIGNVAARYGISQGQLIDANGLTGGMIYVGQRLNLVAPASPVSPPAAPGGAARTHVVTAGQTLSSIAQRYGTTVRAIQTANSITDPDSVVVGRRLTVPSSAGGTAALRCPVAGPVRHMNDWGFPRSGGRFHQGHDLFAARGTPAVAVVSGTAVQTTGRIGGLQVKLLGDDGVSYSYTHLDRFGTAGRVSAGTIVGYVGATGNAVGTSPHVHFEVHPRGGAPVNPYPLVAPVC